LKILLDENFPLPLYRRLREAGYDAEHVIALGKRGMPDAELRRRLAAEPIVLLTNDTEFEDIGLDYAGKVIISRLPQRLPITERVEIWFYALQRFLECESPHKLFDLLPDGQIVAWEICEFGRVRTTPASEG
jgi:predicted nuclease of predicted toxin-antitoxin system